MKRIFISQPMKDKDDSAIKAERDKVMRIVRRDVFPDDECLEIASYFGSHARFDPLESVGMAIQMMNNADLVVMCPGWMAYRGCSVEYICACWYDKKIALLSDCGDPDKDIIYLLSDTTSAKACLAERDCPDVPLYHDGKTD